MAIRGLAAGDHPHFSVLDIEAAAKPLSDGLTIHRIEGLRMFEGQSFGRVAIDSTEAQYLEYTVSTKDPSSVRERDA